MKSMLKEFKEFAAGGNMLDLALGFIIGAAFATLVESLATDIIMDFIAALGGAPDTSELVWKVGKGEVHYGNFLANLISFVIMAAVLFLLVKAMIKYGLGNFRAQGQKECGFCKEFIAVDALVCRHCTQPQQSGVLPTPEEAAEL